MSRNPVAFAFERRSLTTMRRVGCLMVAFAALGCGKLGRVSECRTIARTVNPTLDRIEGLVKAQSPKVYHQASTAYEGAATELRKQKLPSLAGQQFAQEYADMLSQAAAPLTQYADALERNDRDQMTATRTALEHVVHRQTALNKRLQAFCDGR